MQLKTYLPFIFLLACSDNNTIPCPDNIIDAGIEEDITDASVEVDVAQPNTCNAINSYSSSNNLQKFACKNNDGLGGYYWRSWSIFNRCDQAPCPDGAVCYSFLGDSRCVTDYYGSYCRLDGVTKYYCSTQDPISGSVGWVWVEDKDCMKDDCITGSQCGIVIPSIGYVFGVCGN